LLARSGSIHTDGRRSTTVATVAEQQVTGSVRYRRAHVRVTVGLITGRYDEIADQLAGAAQTGAWTIGR